MSNKTQNSPSKYDDYDETKWFCGLCVRRTKKQCNVEQSKLNKSSGVRQSVVKPGLDGSNAHYGTSQLIVLQTTDNQSQLKNSQISPLVSSFIIPIPIDNPYPFQQLFLLKNKKSGDCIYAKITDKRFKSGKPQYFIDVTQSMIIDHSNNNEDIYFNCKTPDLVSKYIAQRIKNQIHTLAEYGCGDGGNTVQFAKYLDFVIAVDIDTGACLTTRQNCDKELRGLSKVEIINADIFSLKQRLIMDCMFINPTTQGNQCKDLLTECSPNLKQLFGQIYDKIENLIIQLPAQIDYSQLPLLLNINQQYNKKQFNDHSKIVAHCTLEIEKIYINEQHVYNIIYYGKIVNIAQDELRKLLIQQLTNDEVKEEAIEKVIVKLKERIGGLVVVYELLQAQGFKYYIDQFLQKVCEKYKLDYNDYAFLLYSKLSKEYSQATDKLRNSSNQYSQDQDDLDQSPKFSYNLGGLQKEQDDNAHEFEVQGLSYGVHKYEF